MSLCSSNNCDTILHNNIQCDQKYILQQYPNFNVRNKKKSQDQSFLAYLKYPCYI